MGTDYGTPAVPTPLTGTSWDKRRFILEAYEEIGIPSYVFDHTPEMLQSALRKLDAMMAGWYTNYGIDIGYPLPISETSDLDDATAIEYANNEAVYLNLAVLLAPKHGKEAAQSLKATAKARYLDLIKAVTASPQMTYPGTLPRGAGSKNWDFPFVDEE